MSNAGPDEANVGTGDGATHVNVRMGRGSESGCLIDLAPHKGDVGGGHGAAAVGISLQNAQIEARRPSERITVRVSKTGKVEIVSILISQG